MKMSIRKFMAEEDGITALEYGLLAAIVAGLIVAAFKTPLEAFFAAVFSKINTAAGTATGS